MDEILNDVVGISDDETTGGLSEMQDPKLVSFTTPTPKKQRAAADEWTFYQNTQVEFKRKESEKKWYFESKRMKLEEESHERSKAEASANLRILEANASLAEMNTMKQLIIARKELKEAGCDEEEIDRLLPIKKP